jgi:L-fuconolactonase
VYLHNACLVGRCMLESNFPVDKWGVSYTVLWNTYKRLAAEMGLSEEQKAALFSGTATRVYTLKHL